MEFTSWDACLRQPDALEHHGIKGMKHGVRRYQNEDGSLTPLGMKRYGVQGTGRSARKMARDFNNLDRGYANVAAEHKYRVAKTLKYAHKATQAKGRGRTGKAEKMKAKSLKQAQLAAKSNSQKRAIEQLQWKIIGKAAQKGYTTKSQAVTRIGLTGKQRAMYALSGSGGAVGSLAGGAVAAKRGLKVSGQQVKITKRGDGRTSIVNYRNADRYAQQERERERKRQIAKARR